MFAQSWNNDLGLDVTVRAGDATSVRQQWNERKLPGSVLVRTNETRWNGLSITRGMYTYAAGAKPWRSMRKPTMPEISITQTSNIEAP